MNALLLTPALVLGSLLPDSRTPCPAPPAHHAAEACIDQQSASGEFCQTGITSLEVRTFGPITIIDQTSFGVVSGTLSGSFEDRLRVVILPNGSFVTVFRLNVDCTIDDASGSLILKAWDIGHLVDETTAEFAGLAAITGSSGGLSGTTGVFEIEGTVDLSTGLSTYTYSGTVNTP